MKSHTRHVIVTSAVLGVLAIGAGVFAWSGLYNIGADDAHTRPVYSMLQMMRERSVTARSRKLHAPPNLDDAARISQGAGNYNAMCTGCHLAPGMAETELSKGLYPAPPNLSEAEVKDPSHHFWVIKHGIKASGMPAWGKSMSDDYIWNMVAFLQQLPKLNEAQYQALISSSGGHDHGGGETMASMPGMAMGGAMPHNDPPGAHDQPAGDESKPHNDAPGAHDQPAVDESKPHTDAPGAHDKKRAASESKAHVDAPGAPPHGH